MLDWLLKKIKRKIQAKNNNYHERDLRTTYLGRQQKISIAVATNHAQRTYIIILA